MGYVSFREGNITSNHFDFFVRLHWGWRFKCRIFPNPGSFITLEISTINPLNLTMITVKIPEKITSKDDVEKNSVNSWGDKHYQPQIVSRIFWSINSSFLPETLFQSRCCETREALQQLTETWERDSLKSSCENNRKKGDMKPTQCQSSSNSSLTKPLWKSLLLAKSTKTSKKVVPKSRGFFHSTSSYIQPIQHLDSRVPTVPKLKFLTSKLILFVAARTLPKFRATFWVCT